MSKYKYTTTFTFEGKRYYVRANSKSELAEKKARKMIELQEGTKLVSSNTTMRAWAEHCFDTYKSDVKPITLQNQKLKADKWILSSIGSLRVKSVKPLHCQQIMNEMDGMAQDTIRKVYQLMNFFFEKAVQNSMIRDNPARDVTIPKGGKTSRRAITEHEREHIIKVADEEERYTYFLFMLMCGLRPSEVANIRPCDIKEVKGKHLLHVRGTKTENADRQVPVPQYLYDRIPLNKAEPFDYIYTNERGGKLSEGNRQALWRSFKRRLNLSMGCRVYRNALVPPYPVASDLVPYCLRHTYCTDLMKSGVDIRTAQKLMGHSDITITANTYTHCDEEVVLNALELIENHG